ERPGHRVTVEGVVTLLSGDGVLYLKDDSGSLSVAWKEAREEPAGGAAAGGPPRPGDRIAVAGFAASHWASVRLHHAVWRRTGSEPLPAPTPAGAEADMERFDADWVTMEGRVIGRARLNGLTVLTVQAGDRVVDAAGPGEAGPGTPADLRAGSRVRLTGVCDGQSG